MSGIGKLTRADVLLALVREETHDVEGCDEQSFFIPRHGNGNWCSLLREFVFVSGPGDASALRGLVTRGLIKPVTKTVSMGGGFKYAFRVTEDGMVRYENVLRGLAENFDSHDHLCVYCGVEPVSCRGASCDPCGERADRAEQDYLGRGAS